MYHNPFVLHQFIQQLPYLLVIFRHAAIRPLRIVNMHIPSIGYKHLRNSDSSLLSVLPFPIGRIIVASHLPIFYDIAQHNNTLYLVLADHLFEVILGVLQWALGDDQSPVLREWDPIGVDVSLF